MNVTSQFPRPAACRYDRADTDRLTRFASLVALLLCLTLAPRAVAAGNPNIVFILIDDMGWADLACYGHKFHETPHIDRLASRGLRFTNFYAATPVCSSTRSTIQTGQYSARTAITDFIPGHWRPYEKLIVPPIEHHLRDGVRTPGDVLRAAGYTTGYFGKWHLGDEAAHGPEKHGYQVTHRTLAKPFADWRKPKDDKAAAPTPGPKSIDLLTDQALYFIESHRDRPFFLFLSHHAVHIPVEADEADVKKYEAKPKPPSGVNHPVYAAMIERLDRSVGRILQRLDELALTEKTIVIFTSDNGGLKKIFTGVGETVSTNAPLSGEKGTLYEGGIRVPLIVRWPGVAKPGAVCDVPATTADLLPTFCDVAAVKLPDQPIDGLSLAPLLKNPAAKLERAAIFFHYPHYHHSRPAGAIRAGDFKLIEFFDDESMELYDLSKDPGETTNLAASMPAKAKEMANMLAAWRVAVGARMPTPNPHHDPQRAAQWVNRQNNQPLNVDAMAENYRSRVIPKRNPTP